MHDPKRGIAFRSAETDPVAVRMRGKRLIFNDYRDLRLLQNGKTTGLVVFSPVAVRNTTEPAVQKFATDKPTRWIFARDESTAGALDVRMKLHSIHPDKFFEIGNVIYNAADASNFFWGHALARIGISWAMAKAGSEGFSFFEAYKTNGALEHLSGWRKTIPISWRGDDSADQRAIRHGYDYFENQDVTDVSIWRDSDYDAFEDAGLQSLDTTAN